MIKIKLSEIVDHHIADSRIVDLKENVANRFSFLQRLNDTTHRVIEIEIIKPLNNSMISIDNKSPFQGDYEIKENYIEVTWFEFNNEIIHTIIIPMHEIEIIKIMKKEGHNNILRIERK